MSSNSQKSLDFFVKVLEDDWDRASESGRRIGDAEGYARGFEKGYREGWDNGREKLVQDLQREGLLRLPLKDRPCNERSEEQR